MSFPMENWPPRHRITVDEYYRMAEVGLLAPDARVELIEGGIVDMPPIGSPHGGTVNYLAQQFIRTVGDAALVIVQSPVRLSDYSEPVPDLAVVQARETFYRDHHPSPEETLLMIEVSDTTLSYDRRVKVPLYARHGIPEAWIVDLKNRQLHCFRSPEGSEYQRVISTDAPGTRSLFALPGIQVDLSGLMG